MLTKHKFAAVVTALLGTFGLMFATAGSAAAGIYRTGDYVKATYTGVRVTAVEKGDVMTVCDTSNSFRAEMTVSSRGVYYTKRVTAGPGNCVTARASNGYNLPEGKTVTVTFRGENCTCFKQFSFYNNH